MLALAAEDTERRTMATTNHETPTTCPICSEETLRRVRCSHASCAFVVTTCERCDREQIVAAFVADHEKDCAHGPVAVPLLRPATFVAPRRAA